MATPEIHPISRCERRISPLTPLTIVKRSSSTDSTRHIRFMSHNAPERQQLI